MSFEEACDLSELTDGLPLAVDVGCEEVAIVQHEGEYFAIRDECSHAKVPLSEGDAEFDDDGRCTIECYLHGSRFDLRTGAAINLPATRPVPIYPTRVEGTTLLVDTENPTNDVFPD